MWHGPSGRRGHDRGVRQPCRCPGRFGRIVAQRKVPAWQRESDRFPDRCPGGEAAGTPSGRWPRSGHIAPESASPGFAPASRNGRLARAADAVRVDQPTQAGGGLRGEIDLDDRRRTPHRLPRRSRPVFEPRPIRPGPSGRADRAPMWLRPADGCRASPAHVLGRAAARTACGRPGDVAANPHRLRAGGQVVAGEPDGLNFAAPAAGRQQNSQHRVHRGGRLSTGSARTKRAIASPLSPAFATQFGENCRDNRSRLTESPGGQRIMPCRPVQAARHRITVDTVGVASTNRRCRSGPIWSRSVVRCRDSAAKWRDARPALG